MGDFVKVEDKSEYDAVTNEADVRTDIKVGGTGSGFVPNINMRKWDSECWLNVIYPFEITNEIENFSNGEIEIELEIGGNKEKHKFKIDEDGHLEYEIELESKPSSNKIELDLDFPVGLEFWYQDTIENEYNKDHWGCEDLAEYQSRINRPANVECSYAVYWKEENNQYKTGKFCHIYRPKVIDSDNNEIWCNQVIENNKWTIEIDQTWLNNAVYPITIDPNLGFSTKGGSDYQNDGGDASACHDTTDGSGGDTVQLHVWCKNDGANDALKICVYNDDGSEDPDTQLLAEVTITVDNGFDGQKDVNYETTLAASTKYWIAFCNQTSARIAGYYDSADAGRHAFYTVGSWDLEASWNTGAASHNTTKWSIWADYSAVGGVAPTGTIYGPLVGPLGGVI